MVISNISLSSSLGPAPGRSEAEDCMRMLSQHYEAGLGTYTTQTCQKIQLTELVNTGWVPVRI